MRSKTPLLVIVPLLLALCSPAQAGNGGKFQVFAQAEVGDLSDYGFQAPYTALGIGGEYDSPRFSLSARLMASSTDKNVGVTSADFFAEALVRSERGFVGGLGVHAGALDSDEWDGGKSVLRASAVVGWERVSGRSSQLRNRLTLAYIMPGQDVNSLQGYTLRFSSRWRPEVAVEIEGYRTQFEEPWGTVESNGALVRGIWYPWARR